MEVDHHPGRCAPDLALLVLEDVVADAAARDLAGAPLRVRRDRDAGRRRREAAVAGGGACRNGTRRRPRDHARARRCHRRRPAVAEREPRGSVH